MITSLYLQNFKGFARAEIPLGRLTVIVGPNGSGKTSILEALEFLSHSGTERREDLFSEHRSPMRFYRRPLTPEAMIVGASAETTRIRVRFEPQLTDTPARRNHDPDHPLLRFLKASSYHRETREGDGGHDETWGEFTGFPPAFGWFGPSEILRLEVARLASPSNGTEVMGPDGSGMASDLATMALGQPDRYQQIQRDLRSVVPSIEQFRIDRNVSNATRKAKLEESIVFDFSAAKGIPADLASEGTLLVLGLLTALSSPLRPGVMLLDDLDRGLHPTAQEEVLKLLRTILDQNPELQIVATTHSPYLVDCLEPEEVRMTTLSDDGTARCGSLVDCPEFDKWKDEMMPGEMWSLFGEKWVARLEKGAEAI